MLAIRTVDTFAVTVSAAEVSEFRAGWPCSRLPDVPIAFVFQVSNGDIVDIIGTDYDGEDMLALSEDAQRYGESTLNIDTPHFKMTDPDGTVWREATPADGLRNYGLLIRVD